MFVLQEKNNPFIEYVTTGWLSGLNQEAARDLMAHGAVGRAELIGNLYAWWYHDDDDDDDDDDGVKLLFPF